MLGMSNKERVTKSHATALKRARILKCLSRKDLAKKLNVSYKAIGITSEEFLKIKRGKKITKAKRVKNVITNNDRRSYRKLITKESQVLKSLRRLKDISQDQASALCRYSRPTIGHIENGRIALNKERIVHIVTCYGFTYLDFERSFHKEKLRDEIIDLCFSKMKKLSDEKLAIVWGIIESMG